MIIFESVSMRFFLGREKITNLKEYLVRRIKHDVKFDEFWALRGVSFRIGKGEVFGIIGLNVAGVIKPTMGTVGVNGNISPLIELGAGFDFDLTARENIFLNGAVLGYQKAFLKQRFEEIIAFSEISQFIDVPLKNFSSGMIARLAFSIATLVDPEVLLVDEILSVGDMRFQEKSEAKMHSMMEGGATVVFVSHNIGKVREICHKVLWLEKGQIRMIGEANTVCASFTAAMGGQGL
jgi:ABC-2 type transport system ATP-binding protein